MYGDTRRIADAIAEGLAEHVTTATVEVSVAPRAIESDLDLLVVGGPTHVHGMTTALTRAQAIKQAQGTVVSTEIGIREWLDQILPIVPAIQAATFDTRVKGAAILTGSAANGYRKHLRDLSFRIIAPAESFFVGMREPQGSALLPGELERAKAWGTELAARLGARAAITVA
jgi:hypothetical protein